MTVVVRPLREGETPIIEATVGRTMKFIQEDLEESPPVALQVTPVQSVPQSREQSPVASKSHTESSDSVRIIELEGTSQGVKRKGTSGGYGAGTSKRRRHLIADEESSAEEDASDTDADKDIPKSPPLM